MCVAIEHFKCEKSELRCALSEKQLPNCQDLAHVHKYKIISCTLIASWNNILDILD